MRKMPTVLQRDPNDRAHVLLELTPGCEWVLGGEGVPTRKYDGTCVMLDADGHWWARREVKPGKRPPSGWLQIDYDEVTGKAQGYEPIEQSPFAIFHNEALVAAGEGLGFIVGTYELLGPKINGNPEGLPGHVLQSHSHAEVLDLADEPPPYTVGELVSMARFAGYRGWEGIVWHHRDGRMAKLKVRDLPPRPNDERTS